MVNWGEIYYNTMRKVSQEAAEQKAKEIAALPIDIVGCGRRPGAGPAGRHLQSHEKLSYADAFAAALAKLSNAELVTGDPEFKAVEGEIKIGWLR